MSGNWRDFIELPGSASATPLKPRHPAADNIQSSGNTNNKKRAPTTPLTPSLIQRNVLKRQVMEHAAGAAAVADESVVMEEFKAPFNPPRLPDEEGSQATNDFEISQSDGFAVHPGSPKHRRSSTFPLSNLTSQSHINTPRISVGIKQAVKENKKSRLQILKASKHNESSLSDSDYSDVSTIAGDTPNYKFRENLVYYKNGYYMENIDDSFSELERSQIVNEKELRRMDELVNFMKLERKFQDDKMQNILDL